MVTPRASQHERPGDKFRVDVERPEAGVAVVKPDGEMDIDSAGVLRRALLGVIEDGARIVTVDLETTTFVDSMTLGVLLGAVRKLQEQGGELRVACADPNIKRIFELTLLDRVFAIYPSREAALGRPAVT